MLTHHTRFLESDIWYLHDTELFNNRKILIGKCPICSKEIARFDEVRILDNKIISKLYSGKKVNKLLERFRHQIIITKKELTIIKGKTFGLCYGVTKEIKSRRKENYGEIIGYKIYQRDFYGQTELIKVEMN